MSQLKVIFFDLDDTLFDAKSAYERGLKSAWRVWCRVKKESWPQFIKRYGRARQTVKRRLASQPAARSRLLYFKAMVEDWHGKPYPIITLELMTAYESAWQAIHWEPTKNLLKQLKKEYRLGIITNLLCEMQFHKLISMDPTNSLFEVIVTSEEMGVEKPDSLVFLEACRRAGCKPAEALMVGDDRLNDFTGALRAGLRAAYLNPGKSSRKTGPRSFQIQKLTDLPPLLSDVPHSA